jgi:hypothetical protein
VRREQRHNVTINVWCLPFSVMLTAERTTVEPFISERRAMLMATEADLTTDPLSPENAHRRQQRRQPTID